QRPFCCKTRRDEHLVAALHKRAVTPCTQKSCHSDRSAERAVEESRCRWRVGPMVGGERSLHCGRRLPPVEMTTIGCVITSVVEESPEQRHRVRIDCLYRTAAHVIPTGARSGGISVPVVGGAVAGRERSLHCGRRLPPVEMTIERRVGRVVEEAPEQTPR